MLNKKTLLIFISGFFLAFSAFAATPKVTKATPTTAAASNNTQLAQRGRMRRGRAARGRRMVRRRVIRRRVMPRRRIRPRRRIIRRRIMRRRWHRRRRFRRVWRRRPYYYPRRFLRRYRYRRHYRWLVWGGVIPAAAIILYHANGVPVYLCRARHHGVWYRGTARRGEGLCYINVGDKIIAKSHYYLSVR